MVSASEAPGWRRGSGAGYLALGFPPSRSCPGAWSDIYGRRNGAGCGETCVNGTRGDLPVGAASVSATQGYISPGRGRGGHDHARWQDLRLGLPGGHAHEGVRSEEASFIGTGILVVLVSASKAPGWRRDRVPDIWRSVFPSSISCHGAWFDIRGRRPGAGCGRACVHGARGGLQVLKYSSKGPLAVRYRAIQMASTRISPGPLWRSLPGSRWIVTFLSSVPCGEEPRRRRDLSVR